MSVNSIEQRQASPSALRRLVTVAASLALGCAISASAYAQTWPSRPMEFVVHTSPGGGTDLFARFVSDVITRNKLVSQPINIMNRAGGSGAIAYTYIKTRQGEPHTVMTVATLAMLTQILKPELEIRMEHFTPLAFFASDPQAVTVPADSPFKTFKDLVAGAKSSPEGLSASVTSAGGSGHMLAWMIERQSGGKVRIVFNKSGGDALIQVMGSHTQFSTENVSEGYAAVQGKKLRVLAVSSLQRLPIVPDAPTLKEVGMDVHMGTGRGFAMPGNVPKDVAARMEAVLKRVHDSQEWKDHAEKNMFENIWMGSADYAKHLAFRLIQQREFLTAVGIIQKP
jgi:putative tricarboxylic transport membrane protein